MAVNSPSLDLYLRLVPAMGGVIGGREWAPFVALVTSDELKVIAGTTSEKILTIRAQSGSGWDEEEEAKSLVKEYLGSMAGVKKVGT